MATIRKRGDNVCIKEWGIIFLMGMWLVEYVCPSFPKDVKEGLLL